MDNGRESIRHRSHLCHNIKSTSKVCETKVQFSIPDNEEKPESDATSDDSSTKDRKSTVQVGVTTRSMSKERFSPSTSALPGKSCLKARKNE